MNTRKKVITLCMGCLFPLATLAQFNPNMPYNELDQNGQFTPAGERRQHTDSLGTDKEIPKGLKVWTVDRKFGDIAPATPDTLSHMFMNSIFTTGLRGEYNTTGNLGAPRINRIFIDRKSEGHFIFTQPYRYFLTPISDFHFTNTLSPITNITFNTAGDRITGEDHFTAKYAVNAGKRLGVGFKFDYLYGRGYYASQSTSHFNYSMYGSYIGDRYQAHLLLSTNHQKVTENGGIANDDYIVHPEMFSEQFATNDIPTVLERNWNRNDNSHIFLTHRYSVGFKRKVKMTEEEIKARKFAMEAKKDEEKREEMENADKEARKRGEKIDPREREERMKEAPRFAGRPENAKIAGKEPTDSLKQPGDRIKVDGMLVADSLKAQAAKEVADTMWMKDEYVPVTSFIHTLDFSTYKRIYQAYATPENYYAHDYDIESGYQGADSLYDKTRHMSLRNTFSISLLEGFNKWAKAGVKVYAAHEMRRFVLPEASGTTTWNEQNVYIGGQLSKTQGNLLRYNATAEFGLTGEDATTIKVDATADLRLKLLGDTVSLQAEGFFHRVKPTFYFRHYHSRHYLWDNDGLDNITHTRIQGTLSWTKTRTKLRVAVDEMTNYTYFALSHALSESGARINYDVNVRQSGAINLLTAQLIQDFTVGPLNWENVVTYQKSSDKDALPVPDLNIYTNLYLRFKIAKVLRCDLGADARYFTKYYAPDYAPGLGQYAVQEGDDKVEVGNYPVVNVYANFHLKHTRFFVMMSHVNSGKGSKEYFFTPHYPLNDRILRFGLSWNFFN